MVEFLPFLVTYATPFPWKNPSPKVTEIVLSSLVEKFPNHLINLTAIMEKEVDPSDVSEFLKLILDLANDTLTNTNMQKLMLDDTQQFDAVIIEWLFSDLLAGLAVLYECPLIWFSTVEPHWMVLSLVDVGLNPAYSPDSISLHSPPFSFKQRVEELLKQIAGALFKQFMVLTSENKLYTDIFGPIVATKGRTLPAYDDVRYNASLILGNSHVTLGPAIRLPQNYKPILGYHINPNVQPLSENLKRILDSAKHGVIYFSMGSNLKSKDMPDKLKNDLLKMFGMLKYTVIWKFEEIFSNLPKNVHVFSWAPQPSILEHRNTVLFITHGGLLSITETIHYGKPVIGIPVYADQFINVGRAVKKGFGKRVDLAYSMVEDLRATINEILNDSRYAGKAKELSLIYHDRPVPPTQELVHWVNHVVRTGGNHMRSPALRVPIYQKLYLDLLAIVVTTTLAAIFLIKRLLFTQTASNKEKIKNM